MQAMPNLFHEFFASIKHGLLKQQGTALLWAVVAFVTGIGLYFAWPSEPALGATGFGVVASLSLAVLLKGRPWLRKAVLGGAILCFGMFYASWHASSVDTVMLRKTLPVRDVSGEVTEIEFLKTGLRLTLKDVTIADFPAEETPKQVRLSVRSKKPLMVEIGMRVRLRAGLLPPAGPMMEGGFDFARYFYFRNIGAVGYGLNPITVEKPAEIEGFRAFWQHARHRLSSNIRAHLPPVHAAIATGLITGDDSAIDKDTYEVLRAANLLHIIAISGSHMVVIAGVAFLLFRMVFLCLPGFGLRLSAKKLAAFCTLLAITAYLLITGVEISALRAYVMMVFILLAVMLGRTVRPLRALMMTAAIMLLYDPSDLMEPGFQLSFAATLAMIAVAEPAFLRFLKQDDMPLLKRLTYSLPWVLLVSVVAEWVTAPLVVYMFNQFSPYGMLANALAGPVVSVLIMPFVALYFLTVPFGMEAVSLWVLNQGIGLLLDIAHFVASFAHSLLFVPSQPGIFIGVYGLGLVFLCLWKGRARWLALPVMVLCSASFLITRTPDLVISPDMRHIVARLDGQMHLLNGRYYALVPTMLAHAMGMEKLPSASKHAAFACEGKKRERRCVAQTQKGPIILDFTWDKTEAACALAKEKKAWLLVTDSFFLRCKGQEGLHVLTPWLRRVNGAYSFWFDAKGNIAKQQTTRDLTGKRAWSSLRE